MKKYFLFILLIFLGLQCRIVIAEEAKSRLESYLNEHQSLVADFEQSLISEKKGLQELSNGKFYLSRPGKFRWDYTEPFEQSIIADGEKIWVYDKDLDQVTIRDMRAALADSPALLLSDTVSINDQFQVTTMTGQDKMEWFILKPKSEENQYIDIRLAFVDAVIEQMELRDNFGQITKIHFSDQKANATIDVEIFNFKPPAGVDVLDAGAESPWLTEGSEANCHLPVIISQQSLAWLIGYDYPRYLQSE